jgi:hypothetical protein
MSQDNGNRSAGVRPRRKITATDKVTDPNNASTPALPSHQAAAAAAEAKRLANAAASETTTQARTLAEQAQAKIIIRQPDHGDSQSSYVTTSQPVAYDKSLPNPSPGNDLGSIADRIQNKRSVDDAQLSEAVHSSQSSPDSDRDSHHSMTVGTAATDSLSDLGHLANARKKTTKG